MVSIYFYGCITMDGYLADKNHNIDWLYDIGSIEETNYYDFYKNMDIIIMGKKTFDELAKSESNSKLYPTTKNYVFTHEKELPFKEFIPVNGNIIDFIKSIEKNKNIWIVGGNEILAPLLSKNMVDKMIIQIAPILLGEGIPLFTQNNELKKFKLETVNNYGQFAELVYNKI